MLQRTGAGGCGCRPAAFRPVVALVASTLTPGTSPAAVARAVPQCAPEDIAVVAAHSLHTLPHFPGVDGLPDAADALLRTRLLLGAADGVLLCVEDFAEMLPATVANMLQWAIATGCLDGKRVGWLDVSPMAHDGGLAAQSLSAALSFAGATVVTRRSLAVSPARLQASGGLLDRSALELVGQVLRALVPPAGRGGRQ